MDREITIQSRTLATTGDPTAFTYTTLATGVWAEKLDARALEKFVGAQVAAQASQAFRIRFRNDVSPENRVVDEEGTWNVVGTPEGQGRRAETILLVTRLNDA
jgi:head-tail adaptor